MTANKGSAESTLSTTSGNTESTLSTTPEQAPKKMGRPARASSAPMPWSVRGVESETRRVLEKAAQRVGKTIGQYLNEDVRGFAQGQLTQTQLPTAPADIQNQIDHLTKMVERIVTRLPEPGKKNLWQRLFG